MFQAGQQSPPLALDLCVEPPAKLLPSDTQRHLVPMEEFVLLIGVQSSRHAPPQDQPFDLALQFSGESESGHIDFARLRDSPIVRRRAEARPQAKTEKVQPAGFMSWTLFAPVGHFRQRVAEPA